MKPPCANWDIWIGNEIEGTSDIGTETLFVRNIELLSYPLITFANQHRIKRIWFCKEFTDWSVIRQFLHHPFSILVCMEVELPTDINIPLDILQMVKIYWKLPIPVKKGDFVCVGSAYNDEAFEIGTGSQVMPEQYMRDKRIL